MTPSPARLARSVSLSTQFLQPPNPDVTNRPESTYGVYRRPSRRPGDPVLPYPFHAMIAEMSQLLPGPKLTDVTLAVLAGGEGSRMGAMKGAMRLRGKAILDYLLDQWAWPGPTLLVTAPGRERPPGWERFDREATDPVAGQGPLRGVLTALEGCRTDTLVVTTVDMPAVAAPHLAWLVARLGATPGAAGMLFRRPDGVVERVEPFPSAFAARARDDIAAHLAAGRRSVHSILDRPGFLAVAPPPEWGAGVWANLNTPADVAAFERGE